jgi:Prokaryotic phospholipase A2
MTLRRLTQLLIAAATGVVLAVSLATPAAAVTIEQKLAVLSNWTQATTSSYNAWNSARQNQAAWADYAFDWSTDYCSDSPDQPLGFDFRLPCWRHDFGYRNYKAVGQFPANKSRIDDYFYFDLKAKCNTYNIFVRPACLSLAWSYYQAVKNFGSLRVRQADLNRAGQLKTAAETAVERRAAAGAGGSLN